MKMIMKTYHVFLVNLHQVLQGSFCVKFNWNEAKVHDVKRSGLEILPRFVKENLNQNIEIEDFLNFAH